MITLNEFMISSISFFCASDTFFQTNVQQDIQMITLSLSTYKLNEWKWEKQVWDDITEKKCTTGLVESRLCCLPSEEYDLIASCSGSSYELLQHHQAQDSCIHQIQQYILQLSDWSVHKAKLGFLIDFEGNGKWG